MPLNDELWGSTKHGRYDSHDKNRHMEVRLLRVVRLVVISKSARAAFSSDDYAWRALAGLLESLTLTADPVITLFSVPASMCREPQLRASTCILATLSLDIFPCVLGDWHFSSKHCMHLTIPHRMS